MHGRHCVQNGVYKGDDGRGGVYTRELWQERDTGARIEASTRMRMQHPVPCKWDTAGVCGAPVDADYAVTCERAVRRRISQLQKKKTQIIGFNEYVEIDAGTGM